MKIRTVGLTGGIGSGKSTVGHILKSLGAHVIDADAIAHQIYDTDPDLPDQLAGLFGNQILDPSGGKIDRKALGKIVFADPEKRKSLEGLLHPKIRSRIQHEIDLAKSRNPPLIVVEAALMVETGYHRSFDGLIVVKAEPKHQISRITKRDACSEEEVASRIAAQGPLDEKLKAATWIIDNSGSLEDTRRQTEEIYKSCTRPY